MGDQPRPREPRDFPVRPAARSTRRALPSRSCSRFPRVEGAPAGETGRTTRFGSRRAPGRPRARHPKEAWAVGQSREWTGNLGLVPLTLLRPNKLIIPCRTTKNPDAILRPPAQPHDPTTPRPHIRLASKGPTIPVAAKSGPDARAESVSPRVSGRGSEEAASRFCGRALGCGTSVRSSELA